MTVRTNAELATAYAALFDTSQSAGSITAARAQSFITDVIDTLFDSGTIVGEIDDAAITEAKLADDAVTHEKIADESVGADQLIDSGPNNILAVVRSVLEAATGNNQLPYSALRDTPTIQTADDVVTAIRTAVAAMISGGTQSGITVTYQSDNTIDYSVSGGGTADGVLDSAAWDESNQTLTLGRSVGNDITVVLSGTVGGGSTPVSTHQRYGAYGTDQTFTVADFTGGVSSTTNMLTLSGATGDNYPAFWSAMQLTRIDPGNLAFGEDNAINTFTESRLIINSVNGYQYISNSARPAGLINTTWTLE